MPTLRLFLSFCIMLIALPLWAQNDLERALLDGHAAGNLRGCTPSWSSKTVRSWPRSILKARMRSGARPWARASMGRIRCMICGRCPKAS